VLDALDFFDLGLELTVKGVNCNQLKKGDAHDDHQYRRDYVAR